MKHNSKSPHIIYIITSFLMAFLDFLHSINLWRRVCKIWDTPKSKPIRWHIHILLRLQLLVSPTFCGTVMSSESYFHVCTASFLILICKISLLHFLTILVCALSLIQIGSLKDVCGTCDNHMHTLLTLCADDHPCICEGRV
jgi:hypothetical protein